MTSPVLEIRDYALSYHASAGVTRILDELSLTIGPGEVLGLVGESGSAKSSLANAIIRDLPGRIAHESGEIRLSGEDLTGRSEAEMTQIRGRRIAMVFQNAATALNPTRTLGDHLTEIIGRYRQGEGADTASEARALLAKVRLPDPEAMLSRYPHEVSGGEKQRVVLALALACEPELILFDEPTSALDATTAAVLLDLVRDLQRETGVAGLFISHDLGVVADIADRIAVIYGGRIVEEAAPAELFSAPRHPYTQALLSSLPRPSDGRTGRALNPSASAPAPRLGPPPDCIYAASCQWFKSGICDAGPVRLSETEGRKVACLRTGAITRAMETRQPERKKQRDARPVLEASGIKVTFGRKSIADRVFGRASRLVNAVNEVDLSILRGETLALVGESGCGKSSLAKALVGLAGFAGAVKLNGEEFPRMTRTWRSKVQMIFQNPDSSLNPRHSIGKILSRPLRLYRRDLDRAARAAEISRILQRVRLPESYADRYPHQLSGGEKQRVAIARAIAALPDVIICDEITSGLDAAVQASIIGLLREVQQESGIALLYITHDLASLRHVADRVAVMYLGRIIEEREIAGLDHPPYHPYTEALMSSSPSIDPFSESRRVRLTGDAPRRNSDLPGCPFESRCQNRLGDLCQAKAPPLRDFADGHRIYCHHDPETLRRAPPVWRFTSGATETTC